MSSFIIRGGRPVGGRVRASGSKNAALPIMAATLMADGPSWVRNLPRIGDVETLVELMAALGARLAWQGRYDVRVDAAGVRERRLPEDLSRRIRGSVLLAAPLLARLGEVELPLPGGDKIGRRRIDTHLMALEALGARCEACPGGVRLAAPRGLEGADILLDEASVTATENALMAAAMARGRSVIRNAACEPHVQELCHALAAMGGRVEGAGTNELRVEGTGGRRLAGADLTLGADHLEVASLMSLAAVTGGEMLIESASPEHLRMILHHFRRLGVEGVPEGGHLRVPGRQRLEVVPDFRGAIPTVASSPWPGFPADLTSVALVVAALSSGNVLIHEKMYESRLYFVDQLLEMGAKIVVCDPHRAVVMGPSRLHGARVSSPDIRAGMTLLVAALAAEGETRVGNVGQIDRGYERLDDRLRALGADIQRTD